MQLGYHEELEESKHGSASLATCTEQGGREPTVNANRKGKDILMADTNPEVYVQTPTNLSLPL